MSWVAGSWPVERARGGNWWSETRQVGSRRASELARLDRARAAGSALAPRTAGGAGVGDRRGQGQRVPLVLIGSGSHGPECCGGCCTQMFFCICIQHVFLLKGGTTTWVAIQKGSLWLATRLFMYVLIITVRSHMPEPPRLETCRPLSQDTLPSLPCFSLSKY